MAEEITQEKGQIRECTADGTQLDVIAVVGNTDGVTATVWMICDRCGREFTEQMQPEKP